MLEDEGDPPGVLGKASLWKPAPFSFIVYFSAEEVCDFQMEPCLMINHYSADCTFVGVVDSHPQQGHVGVPRNICWDIGGGQVGVDIYPSPLLPSPLDSESRLQATDLLPQWHPILTSSTSSHPESSLRSWADKLVGSSLFKEETTTLTSGC